MFPQRVNVRFGVAREVDAFAHHVTDGHLVVDIEALCNDVEQRAQYYTEMDSLMMQDAPVVVLFYDEVLRFVNKRVKNMGSNPTNLLDLRRVRIVED